MRDNEYERVENRESFSDEVTGWLFLFFFFFHRSIITTNPVWSAWLYSRSNIAQRRAIFLSFSKVANFSEKRWSPDSASLLQYQIFTRHARCATRLCRRKFTAERVGADAVFCFDTVRHTRSRSIFFLPPVSNRSVYKEFREFGNTSNGRSKRFKNPRTPCIHAYKNIYYAPCVWISAVVVIRDSRERKTVYNTDLHARARARLLRASDDGVINRAVNNIKNIKKTTTRWIRYLRAACQQGALGEKHTRTRVRLSTNGCLRCHDVFFVPLDE